MWRKAVREKFGIGCKRWKLWSVIAVGRWLVSLIDILLKYKVEEINVPLTASCTGSSSLVQYILHGKHITLNQAGSPNGEQYSFGTSEEYNRKYNVWSFCRSICGWQWSKSIQDITLNRTT
jgi:hypothetical protein